MVNEDNQTPNEAPQAGVFFLLVEGVESRFKQVISRWDEYQQNFSLKTGDVVQTIWMQV